MKVKGTTVSTTVKVTFIEANRISEILAKELQEVRQVIKNVETRGALGNVTDRLPVLEYFKTERDMLESLIKRFGGVIPPEEEEKR